MIDCLKDIPHFLTGSRRFKTSKPESDIDICIAIHKRHIVYDRVKEANKGSEDFAITDSDYNNGFKFTEDEKQYNIIPLHPRDYVSWYWAANLMESLPAKTSKTRPELHGIHETFIGMIKMYFSNDFIGHGNYLMYCNQEGLEPTMDSFEVLEDDLPW